MLNVLRKKNENTKLNETEGEKKKNGKKMERQTQLCVTFYIFFIFFFLSCVYFLLSVFISINFTIIVIIISFACVLCLCSLLKFYLTQFDYLLLHFSFFPLLLFLVYFAFFSVVYVHPKKKKKEACRM